LAPLPMATIAMTAATPTTMPSAVNADRRGLRRNARHAILPVARGRMSGSHGLQRAEAAQFVRSVEPVAHR
jgi:hypothetical protein